MAIAFALSVLPGATGAQEKKPTLTIILDASRSMWGQINEVNKVVIARQALAKAAKTYQDRINLGLVSYGHRKSSGCDDVELIAKPGPYKAKQFTKSVNSVKPKGSTPIAESLKLAAKATTRVDEAGSLLLISDGLDNCKGDPCATATALKSANDKLTIHVVAFDRKQQKALKKLSCVAEATGGTFAPATNDTELQAAVTAAIDKVLEPPLADVAAAPPPPPQPAPQPAPAAPAPQAAPSETAAPAAPAPQPPVAAITNPQDAKAGKGEAPAAASALTPVSLSAKTTDGGDAIPSGLIWRIYEPRPDKQGRYKLLGTHRTPTLTEALAPGEYKVAVSYGLAHFTKVIEVQAGSSLQDVFVLNAGGLRLSASLSSGKPLPPNAIRYDVFAGEPDQRGNREKVLSDAKPGVPYRLNSGPYHVVSVYGDANAVIRSDVAVEPGRLTDLTFNHSGAKVTFKLVLQPGGEALAGTQWSVLTPGGDVVKESAGALATHILAAGGYSVLARHDGKNYTREFEIQAGESKQIEVVIR